MGLTISTTYVTGKNAGKTVVTRNDNAASNPYKTANTTKTTKTVTNNNPYRTTYTSTQKSYQPKQEKYVAKNDAIKTQKPVTYTYADKYVADNARKDIERQISLSKRAKQLYAEAAVKNIIETDRHKPLSTDASRVASKILAAADYAGVDADSIACIVKRESHFKENGLNVVTGKGPMGLTSIAVKDLYARPKLFDNQLRNLINKYGSLGKVFEAKRSNPSLDLGNLGNILYQYGSWKNLNSAIKKDYDLNLKVGSYIYKHHLNNAMTNKNISIANKEFEAFKNYNGSYLRYGYASSSVTTLKIARNAASNDPKYLAALEKSRNGLNSVA